MLFADGSRTYANAYTQSFYTLHKKGVNMSFSDGHGEYENLNVTNGTYLNELSVYVLPTTKDGYPWGVW
jgi:prepilin-type processing-associated H-X9-DG protein